MSRSIPEIDWWADHGPPVDRRCLGGLGATVETGLACIIGVVRNVFSRHRGNHDVSLSFFSCVDHHPVLISRECCRFEI